MHVGPWPDQPCSAARGAGCRAPGVLEGFPSGRAAVVACLEHAGIPSGAVVAVPECVTGCLATAVRRLARAVPLRSALDGCVEQRAAIVYEQWGWPLPAEAEAAVRERLAGVPVILDRVDSADFFWRRQGWAAFEVLSLSKVLGLDAGGIARRCCDDTFLHCRPPARGRAPSADRPGLVAHPAVRELFKQSRFVHPAVTRWLAGNCAESGVEVERQTRSRTARLILDSPLGAGWPDWMAQALEAGAGPVWAPVLRGVDPAARTRAMASLQRELGVQAAVRTFNWSGNPLSPRFEPSLALPIHSGLVCPAQALSLLSPLVGAP